MPKRKVTHEEWLAQARQLFGEDPFQWKFVCPNCGHVASVLDWRRVGASSGEVAFSCIGRHMKGPVMEVGPVAGGPTKGPCNYAGGGLFRMNPVEVEYPNGVLCEVFEFAKGGHDENRASEGVEGASPGDRPTGDGRDPGADSGDAEAESE